MPVSCARAGIARIENASARGQIIFKCFMRVLFRCFLGVNLLIVVRIMPSVMNDIKTSSTHCLDDYFPGIVIPLIVSHLRLFAVRV